MNTGWHGTSSPFHEGEKQLQERTGSRERMEQLGRRVIRDHLPEQHQVFYGNLSYLFVGSVDAAGQPAASVLTGEPGFIDTSKNDCLSVGAVPHPSDPLARNLETEGAVGILGIDLSNRRRNRVNGRLGQVRADGFDLNIDQAFGNCPRYIHTRTLTPERRVAGAAEVYRGTALSGRPRELVEAADTFFIATATPTTAPAGGADVSHRGGCPGFVRVSAVGRCLSFPDFAGNGHFNTLGNLALSDRAGLLFLDFASGDVLQLSGRAAVDWDSPEIATFEGAERLVRFEINEYIYSRASLGVRFSDGKASPFSEKTGVWA